jgi:uncharacterized membrane protein YbhN (UPF0104 family)
MNPALHAARTFDTTPHEKCASTQRGVAVRSACRLTGPAAAVVVLGVVLWRLGTGPFVDGLEAVDGRTLLLGGAIVLVTTTCSAWRWTMVARGLGVRLSFRAAVAAYYRALFLNLTLPSGIAGDVHRGIRHGREVHRVGRALRAVIWERGAGQAVQIVLTLAVLLALPSPVRSSMPLVAVAVLASALGVVVVARAPGVRVGSRWTRVRNAVVADVRDGVLRRNAFPAIVLASTVAVFGHATTFLVAARSAGVAAPVSRLLPLAFLGLLSMVLPSIAGWGPREGATAWVFAAAGLGADRGAAVAVAYGVMVLVASLPGAVFLIADRLPRRVTPKPRASRRAAIRPEGAADA